jgi:hypothetical protein
MLATCHTEGCPNAEITIDLASIVVDEDGAPIEIAVVMCGVCLEPITDVVASAPYDDARPPADA